MDISFKTYSKDKTIRHYAGQKELYMPERQIFNILEKDLPNMRMLDVGIGTGRTTIHFAGKVREYVGFDYSEEMIAYCKKVFTEQENKLSLFTKDIKDLKTYSDQSFDFVLISFNCIDHVTHQERKDVLKEIYRICKPGGYLAFSTHNINSLNELFKFKFRKNIFIIIKNLISRKKLKKMNGDLFSLMKKEYVIINDGSFNFGIEIYYSKPQLTIDLIRETGFVNTRIFDLSEGREIKADTDLLGNTDFYLYYLCNKPG